MPQPLAVTAFMASPGRFELPAPRLGGVCSIQLSYGDIFDFSWSRMERSASQDFDDLIIRRRLLYPFNYENKCRIFKLFSLFGHGNQLYELNHFRDESSDFLFRHFYMLLFQSDSLLPLFRFHGFNHGCFLEVTPIRFVTQKTVP